MTAGIHVTPTGPQKRWLSVEELAVASAALKLSGESFTIATEDGRFHFHVARAVEAARSGRYGLDGKLEQRYSVEAEVVSSAGRPRTSWVAYLDMQLAAGIAGNMWLGYDGCNEVQAVSLYAYGRACDLLR